MSGYDYGNARLRAIKSHLLSKRDMQLLVEAGSLQGLIAALAKTAYRKPVETALARMTSLDSINEALHYDLVNTLGNLHTFYSGDAKELVWIVLRSYDIHNLKTILRGLFKHAPSAEIVAVLLPVGALDMGILAGLARSPGPRAAIDMLASQGLPFAQPLMALRARHPGADGSEMERALDLWHHRSARQYLQEEGRDGEVLLQALNIEADLANLLTVLRFAHFPGERNLLRERQGVQDLTELFYGPGLLPFSLLLRAINKDSAPQAVETLAGTPYEVPLRAGVADFAGAARLSEFEKHLKRFQLHWAAQQIAKDPLGIGVLIGFLALKTNEIKNIRWIAQGISLGLKPEAIQAQVEFLL